MSKKLIFWLSGLLVAAILIIYFLYSLQLDAQAYYTIGWILAIIVLLVLFNSIITFYLNKYISWLKYGYIRFFGQLFLGIVVLLVIINGAFFLFRYLFTVDPPTASQIVVTNVYGLIIFVPVFSVYFSLHFLRHWQKSEVEAVKFKEDSMRAQLVSLKNHLDPHFLFNNLNILSSLIDKDAAMSQAFLDKFAAVYRAMLQTKADDLILLSEELDFINAYIYLLKVRFEENIQFEINIENDVKDLMLPPLSLQMLIENATKHNIATEKRPLVITIEANEENYLTVSNTLYEKPEDLKNRTGSGLENIKRRYKYFADKEVLTEKTDTHFIAKIPLLTVETI